MGSVYMALYAALLFFVLSPGTVLRLNVVGGAVVTHALVFGLVWYLTAAPVKKLLVGY